MQLVEPWLENLRESLVHCGCAPFKTGLSEPLGQHRELPRTSVENSPRATLSAKAGTGSAAGRRRARANDFVASLLVTGLGAVRLTGPLNELLSMRKRNAATSSSRDERPHLLARSGGGRPRPL